VRLRAAAARVAAVALFAALAAAPGHAQAPPGAKAAPPDSAAAAEERARVRATIASHLGRPYVWGSSGPRSFDCSGFVWRVMQEDGILIKRTTARKYYLSLPRTSEGERWNFGNIVFFDNLKHCGIVATRDTFYHAAVTLGTHATAFAPFWRPKISGVRAMPRPGAQRPPPPGRGPPP